MRSESTTAICDATSYEELVAHALARTSSQRRPRTALVLSSEGAMFRAFVRAVNEGLVDPIIVGSKRVFSERLAEVDASLAGTRIVDIPQPEQAVTTVARMASRGEIDLVVKGGRVPTAEFLRLGFEKGATFVAPGKTLCHIAVFKPERYHKFLILTDAGVVVQPDLMQKVALIDSAVAFGRRVLDLTRPRVAVLAAVEAIYPEMPVTTEAAVLAKMSDRGQIENAVVDGPLSFDCAVDSAAARSKGLQDSQVAGQVDILLAPNMETANGVYRAMALYGRAQVGGVLMGGSVPVALGTRADSAETKFHSIVLGVLAAR